MPFGVLDSNVASWGGLADPDSDGSIDLVLVHSTDKTTQYLNQSPERNALPGTSTSLRSSFNRSQLSLFWQAASDGNQTTPLTYEVRVGTAPGRGDIVAALANPVSGRRLAWTVGNAGFAESMTLNLGPEQLARATRLYWTVQAIDASLAGGGFAPEAVLVNDN